MHIISVSPPTPDKPKKAPKEKLHAKKKAEAKKSYAKRGALRRVITKTTVIKEYGKAARKKTAEKVAPQPKKKAVEKKGKVQKKPTLQAVTKAPKKTREKLLKEKKANLARITTYQAKEKKVFGKHLALSEKIAKKVETSYKQLEKGDKNKEAMNTIIAATTLIAKMQEYIEKPYTVASKKAMLEKLGKRTLKTAEYLSNFENIAKIHEAIHELEQKTLRTTEKQLSEIRTTMDAHLKKNGENTKVRSGIFAIGQIHAAFKRKVRDFNKGVIPRKFTATSFMMMSPVVVINGLHKMRNNPQKLADALAKINPTMPIAKVIEVLQGSKAIPKTPHTHAQKRPGAPARSPRNPKQQLEQIPEKKRKQLLMLTILIQKVPVVGKLIASIFKYMEASGNKNIKALAMKTFGAGSYKYLKGVIEKKFGKSLESSKNKSVIAQLAKKTKLPANLIGVLAIGKRLKHLIEAYQRKGRIELTDITGVRPKINIPTATLRTLAPSINSGIKLIAKALPKNKSAQKKILDNSKNGLSIMKKTFYT